MVLKVEHSNSMAWALARAPWHMGKSVQEEEIISPNRNERETGWARPRFL
jgi:hypothetical protein